MTFRAANPVNIGVVLVVVVVRAIAAEEVKISKRGDELSHNSQTLLVEAITDRVGFLDAQNGSVEDRRLRRNTKLVQFLRCQVDEFLIAHLPGRVAFGGEILQPQRGLLWRQQHFRTPALEV
jgi:hypothetical protein